MQEEPDKRNGKSLGKRPHIKLQESPALSYVFQVALWLYSNLPENQAVHIPSRWGDVL